MLEFHAHEYHADQTFRRAAFRLRGSPSDGWTVERDGAAHLVLGPGYRVLRTSVCGVCSTDLARHHLPFPLPQVTGHEVVATDDDGRRHVVEINASHAARGLSNGCPFCAGGLATHCPERLVLGIHDLPGGFGPWLLVPEHSVLPIPDELPTETAALVEPFAAALHAVDTLDPRPGASVAVLGPRRLGLLVVAALAGRRRERGEDLDIVALARHDELLERARELGATRTVRVDRDRSERFDVVVDTTGNPDALPLALELAREEVHVKSTHGRPSAGLQHLTGLVVDELSIERLATPPAGRVVDLADDDAAQLLARVERETRPGELPRADAVVVHDAAGLDAAIRPRPEAEVALVRPRGRLLVAPDADRSTPLLDAVAGRGLRLSSSRCGDFRRALALLVGDPALRSLGERFVTHRFHADELERAFEVARSPGCVKALVAHR